MFDSSSPISDKYAVLAKKMKSLSTVEGAIIHLFKFTNIHTSYVDYFMIDFKYMLVISNPILTKMRMVAVIILMQLLFPEK